MKSAPMPFEIPGLVASESPSEEWEGSENVSEGRDGIEDRLLDWVVRLGRRWEVVDRAQTRGRRDPGYESVRALDGETEPGRGSHSDGCND